MVGGILAERTVKEIKPQVQDNKEKIQKVIEQVNNSLQKKLETRKQFVSKYSIQDPTAKAQAAGRAAAGRILALISSKSPLENPLRNALYTLVR